MKYGTQAVSYNWKEFLEKCNEVYFDKASAEKAELKLHSMKQGGSQYSDSSYRSGNSNLNMLGVTNGQRGSRSTSFVD